MEETQNKKTFAKLGYSMLDTAEIVIVLNRLLAGYMVFFQKLRSFHWNVKGQDFFDLHAKFEELYRRVLEESDAIAERIRLFGQTPASTYSEYLETTSLKESNSEIGSYEMVKEILTDIRTLLENMDEGIHAARDINDHGTEYMLKSFIYNMEKDHWILAAWIKQNV